jgi:hypothetical protein
MRFTADHAFHIGSQHLRGGMPCQDYSVSGVDAQTAYAIISDGCSSGGRTDVGARIIAQTTSIAITRSADVVNNREYWIGESFAWRDHQAKELLQLKTNDMLATCGYIVATTSYEDINIYARVTGDGAIAWIDRFGHIGMARYDWDGNMPFYRAYQGADLDTFIAAHGEDLDAEVATEQEHWRPSDAGLSRRDETNRIQLHEALKGFSSQFASPSYQFIAVFSDGVTQVDGMDWRDVVAELMNFKSTQGDFVKRRMNRFLKDCLAHGKGPIDDISMACIHIDHEAVR